MWTLLRTRAGEDREVTTGVNWATGRSLVAWTAAGGSPEGPAPHPAQAVGPSWQHLLGQNGVCLLQVLRAADPPSRRWTTNPGVR